MVYTVGCVTYHYIPVLSMSPVKVEVKIESGSNDFPLSSPPDWMGMWVHIAHGLRSQYSVDYTKGAFHQAH